MFSRYISSGHNERYFPIEDPIGLRQSIVPILEFDAEGNKTTGLGTAFRIEQSNRFITAQHIIDHHFKGDPPQLDEKKTIIGFLWPGIAYGTPKVSPNCIAKVLRVRGYRQSITDPV